MPRSSPDSKPSWRRSARRVAESAARGAAGPAPAVRVFVGPLEVAGIGHGFVAGLRSQGLQAEFVSAYPHPFAYASDTSPAASRAAWPVRWWARAGAWRRREPRRAAKALAVVLQQLLAWPVLAWALVRFDAFVFLYGETITNTALEGWLLRVAGKRSIVVFVGSDARPPYVDGGWFPADRPFDARAAIAAAARQRRKVQRLERQASLVVNARATAQFHTRRFVNWFALGIPRAARPQPRALTQTLTRDDATRPLRVLHGPSHPVLKGTAEIRATVEQLRTRGLALELVTIEGRPNAEVLQALAECDLVVDQLYSDTPMAAFATEAASVGRPVIVGGCGADRAAAQVAPLPLPPSVYVRPEQFEATLEALARDAPRRAALGAAGAAFVAAEWSVEAVGARLAQLVRGDVPAPWWCDPSEVEHCAGCGLPEPVARARVAAVIAAGGQAALHLDHAPRLRAAYMAFAQQAAAPAAPSPAGAAA
jgi:glycosyltransferase involved in cell wall biosynthesis